MCNLNKLLRFHWHYVTVSVSGNEYKYLLWLTESCHWHYVCEAWLVMTTADNEGAAVIMTQWSLHWLSGAGSPEAGHCRHCIEIIDFCFHAGVETLVVSSTLVHNTALPMTTQWPQRWGSSLLHSIQSTEQQRQQQHYSKNRFSCTALIIFLDVVFASFKMWVPLRVQ